jgi:hypothetical protein
MTSYDSKDTSQGLRSGDPDGQTTGLRVIKTVSLDWSVEELSHVTETYEVLLLNERHLEVLGAHSVKG